MLKTEKQQRTMVAFIFYLIAMVLFVGECLVGGHSLSFPTIVGCPAPYFIYYVLISKIVDENVIWPIIVIIAICVLLCILPSEGEVVLFEIVEVLLFILQIVVAFIVKFLRIESQKDRI